MSDALATNLARSRKARNLSQEQLAEAAGVGVDTVGRIERGERRTTRPATVAKLAAALDTSSDALLGLSTDVVVDHQLDLMGLRRAVTATSSIPGLDAFTDSAELVSLHELSANIHHAWKAYVSGHHQRLLVSLPTVLADARRLVHAGHGDDKAVAQRLLSTTYRLAAGLAGRLDSNDLAWTAVERALAAAGGSDSPDLQLAVSHRYLAWTLVRQGRLGDAERVAVAAAERIEPRLLERDPTKVGIFGNLLFNAASAALRSGNVARADDLLAVAQAAAVRTGADSATEAAIFGPRVAALQQIDHLMRAGDPGEALARSCHLPVPPGGAPAFWEAGHQLHLAQAAVRVRRDRLALEHLDRARQLAPDWSRRQPLGATVMRGLLDQATRRQGTQFSGLAKHFGVG